MENAKNKIKYVNTETEDLLDSLGDLFEEFKENEIPPEILVQVLKLKDIDWSEKEAPNLTSALFELEDCIDRCDNRDLAAIRAELAKVLENFPK